MAMGNLIDRSLAEVRVTAGLPPRLQPIHLAKFLEKSKPLRHLMRVREDHDSGSRLWLRTFRLLPTRRC